MANMYIVGGVVANLYKNRFFTHRPTKKHKNNKCLEKHSLQLLFNTFSCEINNKEKKIHACIPLIEG